MHYQCITDHNKQWRNLCPMKSPMAREKPAAIGSSIWYSTASKSLADDIECENGFAEYCRKADKIINIIEYPPEYKPCRHVCCQYKDKIYLIDGENGHIILFDPNSETKSNRFQKVMDIPKIGKYPSAAIVHDKIYILNGYDNNDCYLIYDIKTNALNTVSVDKKEGKGIYLIAALEYNNQIMQVGGYNRGEFWISTEIQEDDDGEKKLDWVEKTKWKLPRQIAGGGLIRYKHYIILFGGGLGGITFGDSIMILDLESDEGWREIDMKCPLKSKYLAVLCDDNHIHLFTESTQWPDWKNSEKQHHSIHVSTILGSKFKV